MWSEYRCHSKGGNFSSSFVINVYMYMEKNGAHLPSTCVPYARVFKIALSCSAGYSNNHFMVAVIIFMESYLLHEQFRFLLS